ncbi:GNAT family N-acetyltransferase [Alkalihalobacterium chitinilyticum]|uniref:GNAT family N-acetyltransferase n=1 Tax=Alkalihalobacterium chitinilyticum TaxID=2980103 RepID=A0ABT5VLF5_9BACI|nr:GNAT family protein [Alkalihalobacterium chitinilyticum]MDE5416132.1 GNAT family N-acetyltransferase [Alkalihalobacterium chitinilyticum]
MFLHRVDDLISLKILEMKDAERIFELTDRSRDYLREWLPWLDMTKTVQDTEGFIRMSLKGFAEGNSMNTAILFNEEIVGIAGFNTINQSNKTAQMGYWIGQEYQGNGIITKVSKMLTDYAFNQLGLNKVEIRVAVENKKSRAVPERIGFKNEGCIRQSEWLYDHYVDHIVYGMLAEEWNENLKN